MMKSENYLIEILISIMFILLLFYSSDPVIYDDSHRYLKSSSKDAPLYSMIINLMEKIFNSLNSVIILQTISLAFGIIFFTKTVGNIFKLDLTIKLLISFFLFLPTIKFYNNLLTEPISNALSLLFVSFIIKLIFNFNIMNLFWSGVFVILLLMSRTQFMFLYLVILLIYFGILVSNFSKRNLILLIISFLSILIVHNSLIFFNKNISPSENKNLLNSNRGIFHFIFIDAIYISSIKDTELFENKKLQKTFLDIYEEMDNRKALVKYYDGRGHFGLSFAKIRDNATEPLTKLSSEENIPVIELKKKISLVIISSNLEKYMKLIFKKFYDSTWLFVFVPFFMLLAAMIEFVRRKSNFSLFIIFLSMYALANHSVVYLFGRVQPRYLIYSDFILLIFIFIIFSIFLQKKNEL